MESDFGRDCTSCHVWFVPTPPNKLDPMILRFDSYERLQRLLSVTLRRCLMALVIFLFCKLKRWFVSVPHKHPLGLLRKNGCVIWQRWRKHRYVTSRNSHNGRSTEWSNTDNTRDDTQALLAASIELKNDLAYEWFALFPDYTNEAIWLMVNARTVTGLMYKGAVQVADTATGGFACR